MHSCLFFQFLVSKVFFKDESGFVYKPEPANNVSLVCVNECCRAKAIYNKEENELSLSGYHDSTCLSSKINEELKKDFKESLEEEVRKVVGDNKKTHTTTLYFDVLRQEKYKRLLVPVSHHVTVVKEVQEYRNNLLKEKKKDESLESFRLNLSDSSDEAC